MERFVFVSDLDGTLLNHNGIIPERIINSFNLLREKQVLTVLATGRSVFSTLKCIPDNFYFDYLVSSTGACILEWKSKTILKTYSLVNNSAQHAVNELLLLDLDFTLQHNCPNNHYYEYQLSNKPLMDFVNRNQMYQDYCRPLNPSVLKANHYCQLIAFTTPSTAVETIGQLSNTLNDVNIVRSTSPLDHTTVWIEIYPRQVSKGNAIKWLLEHLSVEKYTLYCAGNDYNDLNMLKMADQAFWVDNTPASLKQNHPYKIIPGNDDAGVSMAVDALLQKI